MYEINEISGWRNLSNYYRTIKESESYKRRRPIFYNISDFSKKDLIANIQNIVSEEEAAICQTDGYYLENSYFTDICFVYDENLNIFPPSNIDQQTSYKFEDLSIYQKREIQEIKGDSLIIFKAGKNNYGHILIEILPKLFLAAQNFDLENVTIIVPTLSDPIKKVFYTACEILQRETGQTYKFHEMVDPIIKMERALFVGPITKHNKFKSPLIVDFINHIKKLSSKNSERIIKRVFIDRNAAYRNIINNEAVKEIFMSYGFEVIDPLNLSFSEQLSLFSNVEYLAGAHGAGLTNICFMPEKSNVFVIDPGFHDFFFWDLANIFDINYHWYFNNLFVFNTDNSRKNYSIDLNKLNKAVANFVNEPIKNENNYLYIKNVDSLNEIGIKFDTDKHSELHDFLTLYERRFNYLRNLDIVFFEIGVLRGGSIKMWREYFPLAKIVGIDMDNDCSKLQTSDITIRIGNASDPIFLEKLISEFSSPTIVIDDGSHRWDHQITTFKYLFPLLKPGGLYIIEDIDTSFELHLQKAPFKGGSSISAFDYIYKLSRAVCAERALGSERPYDDFIELYAPWVGTIELGRRMVIISKKIASGGGPT